jgi:ferritin-like metal-binding protein YciE
MDKTSRFDPKSKILTRDASSRSFRIMKLYEEELMDVYWAEKALSIELPKMIKNAKSERLINALKNQLAEIQEQVSRIEEYFNYWQNYDK